jgi:hypothetical protein
MGGLSIAPLAPSSPHRAICGFDLPREARAIHQRRSLQARAQVPPQFRQPRSIASEFQGNAEIVVRRKNREFLEA